MLAPPPFLLVALTPCTQSFFAIGNAITPSGLELMRLFVRTFNAAVDSLTDLPKVCDGDVSRAVRVWQGAGIEFVRHRGTRTGQLRSKRRCQVPLRQIWQTRCSASWL